MVVRVSAWCIGADDVRTDRETRSCGVARATMAEGSPPSPKRSSRALTSSQRSAQRPTAIEEDAELRSLRELLARTRHAPRHEVGRRAGGHATSGLKWLDDGQRDDIVTLRRRREAEDFEAAKATNRPKWDSSTWHYTPPALKGCRPVTPEPWARDSAAYSKGLSPGRVSIDAPPNHAELIEASRLQYRQEIALKGAGTPSITPRPPSSARGSAKGSPRGTSPPPVEYMAASFDIKSLIGPFPKLGEPLNGSSLLGSVSGWFGNGAGGGGEDRRKTTFVDPKDAASVASPGGRDGAAANVGGEGATKSSMDTESREPSPPKRKGQRAHSPIHSRLAMESVTPSARSPHSGRSVSPATAPLSPSKSGRGGSSCRSGGRTPSAVSNRRSAASGGGSGGSMGGGGGSGGGGGGGTSSRATARSSIPSSRSARSAGKGRPSSPATVPSPGTPTSVITATSGAGLAVSGAKGAKAGAVVGGGNGSSPPAGASRPGSPSRSPSSRVVSPSAKGLPSPYAMAKQELAKRASLTNSQGDDGVRGGGRAQPGKGKGVISAAKARAQAQAQTAEAVRPSAPVTMTTQRMLKIGMMKLYALPGDDVRGLHPLVVDVALLLAEVGRLEEAEPLLREAVETRRHKLGDADASTLRALDSHGVILRALGRLYEAHALFTETVAARKALLERSPTVELQAEALTSMNNLGALLKRLGKLDEALAVLGEALESRRSLLGSDHPDTIVSLNNLASLHMLREQHDAAEALLKEAVRSAFKVLGPQHPNTSKYASNLWALRQRKREHERRNAEPINRWQKALKGNSKFKALVDQLNRPSRWMYGFQPEAVCEPEPTGTTQSS